MPRLHGIPNLRFITKTHWKLRLRNTVTRALPPLLGGVGLALLNLVRCLGLNRATRFSGRLMRSIGPFFPAHRVALANLKGAFPDKSGHEISKLVQGVWDNFGRVMVEYAFTDELYDYNPLDPIQKRILLDQATTKRLFAMRDKGEPMLFFSAHIGSWELSAVAASFDIPLAALYRPFRSQALDDLIIRRRGSGRINFVPARLGAAAQLEKLLQQGSSVGMLVDQHFSGGTDAMFFSRPCKVNPTLARLARKFECPIYGIRAIRLPHSRFSIEITPALVPPRDQDGKIDVVKTMQEITRIVEGWVREHPEQWLWLHRRWRDNRPL
jgi:KDO2-lipid IV(A) lauroyltransferase